jgi:hypothetical protein
MTASTVLPTTMPASPFGDAKAAARALAGARAADGAAAIVVGGGGAKAAAGNGGNNSTTIALRRNTSSPSGNVVAIVASAAAGGARADNGSGQQQQQQQQQHAPPAAAAATTHHLSPAEARSARRRVAREAARAYASVLTWMSLSILVIVFNKWLLAYSGFPFPLALTAWHMVACSAFGWLAVRGPLRLSPPLSASFAARDYCRRVLPVGALYAGSLWLSNSAYLHLSVGFIQMTKSLMPGLVYAFGCAFGTERARGGRAATMAAIAAGVAVCALGERALSPLGLGQQLGALVFEALRLTLVQVLMSGAAGCGGGGGGGGGGVGSANGNNGARPAGGGGMNPIQSLYYVSPACLLFLLVPLIAVELPRYRALASAAAVAAAAGAPAAAPALHFSAAALLANAAAALGLNLAVFALVGRTSALTLNVAGVVKDWALVGISWAAFGSPVTALTLGGYAVCCGGVAAYNAQKLGEMRARADEEQRERRGGGLVHSAGGAGRKD